MKSLQLFIKRAMDIVCSILAIIILIPLFILLALLIKLDSSGPFFFIQDRLGKNGEVFKIIKFRTMIVGAENIGRGLKVESAEDSRITRVGRFLRDTSLDEIPQLLCILRGTMSLVGPRPPDPYHPYNGYYNYPEWAKKRFTMRPGVTGLAQIRVRNSVSWDKRIEIDNEYINKFSIWFDIRILLHTVIALVNRKNVYAAE